MFTIASLTDSLSLESVGPDTYRAPNVTSPQGVVFGGQGEGHVRFGYAIDPHAIEEGLAGLKKYLIP